MKRILFFSFILFTVQIQAQQFGGNPPAVKWQQINSKSVRVIFPAGMDSQAMRIATIIDNLAAQQPNSLGNKHKKIKLVLQNNTVVSNAYVGLGPFRSEFFTTPPANNFDQGSIPWIDQLALHEYRHVIQYNNFDRGLSHVMRVLAGDDGLSLASNAAIPDWFFEGDAVYNETILSKQSRGRLPLFSNAYPSLWKAGKKYSWMKLRNGSLKDYVPDHYNLGYILVNYGHQKYGDDFWKKVTQGAASWKRLVYPFQSAIKKYTGADYKTFTRQALESMQDKAEKEEPDDGELLFPVNKKYVTNYYFPFAAGQDSLVYLKSDYRNRPAFYLKDRNGVHRLHTRAVSIDEQFSYKNGKIVYAAYETDARWGWMDYSVIKLLDINTGVEKTLTRKSKYFSPDISSDGEKIAVVQNNKNGKSEIHVLQTSTGNLLNTIRSAEIVQFSDPKFLNNDSLVTIVKLKNGEMALALAEIASGNTRRLTPPTVQVAGNPCVLNGMVYFTAGFGGDDNIFALRLSDTKIFRVTEGSTGKYFVNASGGKLIWSAFTAEGYQLKQKQINPDGWKEISETEITTQQLRYPVSSPAGAGNMLNEKLPILQYEVRKYKKGQGLFNFHSWRPYYEDPLFSYSVYGENILNTFQSELYYQYDQDEKTNAIGANLIYGALFPYISAGTQLTFDRETFTGNKQRHWNQLDSRIGLNIPLQYIKGRTINNFNIGTNYVLRNEFNKGFFKDSIGNTHFSYLHHFISWGQSAAMVRQSIYPKWGYAVSLAERYSISKKKGNQWVANLSLYLPGIVSPHSIVITGAFQERDTLGNVSFSNRFSYSRGFTGRYFSRMWRLSANYHFPLFYPDWGFGNILYISRVRANGFFDFAKVYSKDKTQTANQRSVGGEIYLDTRWWNQYPLTFGFRVSHLLDSDQFDLFKGTLFEFILPVSIIPR